MTAVCNENRKASAEAFESDVHAEDEAGEDILAEGGKIIAFKFLQPIEDVKDVAAAFPALFKYL